MVHSSRSLRLEKLLSCIRDICIPSQMKLVEWAFDLMHDYNVCNRCMLRVVGIRDRPIHLCAESPPSIPSKRLADADESLCTVCVGLLCLDHSLIASTAMNHLKEYNLKDSEFSLRMQFPPQLSIRNVSMRRFLEQKLSQNDHISEALPEQVEIREIFRFLVADAFSRLSGFQFDVNSPLSLVINMEHQETSNEFKFLVNIPESGFKLRNVRRKGKMVLEGASGEKIARAVSKLSFDQFQQAQMCPPPNIKTSVIASSISCWHDSIFLAGRYNKFQRHISNSAWIIDGKRLAEHSMEELIADSVTPFFKCDPKNYKFSSAGREDADVLMLGSGRPFYLELINPRNLDFTQDQISLLEKKISDNSKGKIGVKDLQIVSRDSTQILKDSASTKSKSYVCLVKVSPPVDRSQLESISAMKNIILQQRTPNRVPRRADLVREKVIEWISMQPFDKNQDEKVEMLKVEMKTSAGTYVKEFIHGDGGRTVPCLQGLLNCDSAECVELDVTAVHLDWPPPIDAIQKE